MTRRLRAYLAIVVEASGRMRLVRLQVAQALGAVSEALVLALLIPLVRVLAGQPATVAPVVHWQLSATRSVIALLAAIVVRAALQWVAAVDATALKLRATDHLRLSALGNLLRADWRHVAGQRRSDIVQATTTEIERVDTALALLLQLGTELLMLGATAVVALAISPALGALSVVALVVVVVLIRRTLRRTLLLGEDWNRRNALLGATITDSLSSLRLIRAHDAADQWDAMLHSASHERRRIEQRYTEIAAALQTTLGVAAVAAAVGLVLLGRELGLGVAALLTLAVVTSRLLSLARGVLISLQAFAQLAPALDNVQRISREAAAHPDATTASSSSSSSSAVAAAPGPSAPPPAIELRAVTAGYGEKPIVRDLSVEVPTGGLAVLTGASGAGKSTLLDVLLGLLPPSAGEFVVDGTPVRDLSAWRARIGYVPQQTVLIPATIAENLGWSAQRTPTDEELWTALEDACVADVVRRLPDGLSTQLNDVPQISGGEQQRLCIARALVRSPGLLLLDEATNALDVATEREVLTRLRARGCTVVMATHRPAAVAEADVVVDLTA